MANIATETEHLNVLIIGAGLSGVGAAYHLQKSCPTKSFAILEGRDRLGGTWDLFRFPGVRSDSDMYTLGYPFRPWKNPQAIADGSAILEYIRETAEEYGIDRKIRFNHRVSRAAWSSRQARWTVEVEKGADKEPLRLTCNFLYMCNGYYDYSSGYKAEWPGMAQFKGRIVHPQFWPADLDYTGKRVVVIGSGATAVTLVPALAKQAAHVTMLQRSPTYIVAAPAEDPVAKWLAKYLPAWLTYRLVRWKIILLSVYLYRLARSNPVQAKQRILEMTRQLLGPDYDVEKHFSPRYNPWDQRVCLVPDADLFRAIKSGKASVVTDQIETFTETGIRLQSSQELPADIIVTATGLSMRLMGGVQLEVDGIPVNLAKTMSYKGMMYSGVPNLASAFGYTNASWTLKCELISAYVCKLLNYMDRHGYNQCTPRKPADPDLLEEPILNFTSGYVVRALDSLPRQGSKKPWKLYQNYLRDWQAFKLGRLNDGIMEFKQVIPQFSSEMAENMVGQGTR